MDRLKIDNIPNASAELKQVITNINAGFDEAQRRINEVQRLADFLAGKPPSNMAHQHHGIVHGGEYVISNATHKAKRDLLNKHYGSERLTHSINNDSDMVVTINVAK